LAYYLKYMSARIQGILSKVNEPNVKPDYSQLKKHEWNLVKRFIFLPFKIYKTHLLLEPHFIYDEAIRLAEAFHIFYEKSPIKFEKNQGLKQARFNILKGALFCLEILAEILGIDLPKKM